MKQLVKQLVTGQILLNCLKFVTGYLCVPGYFIGNFTGYSKFSRVTFGNFHGLLKIITGYSIKSNGNDNNNGLCCPVEICQESLPDNHSAFGCRRT